MLVYSCTLYCYLSAPLQPLYYDIKLCDLLLQLTALCQVVIQNSLDSLQSHRILLLQLHPGFVDCALHYKTKLVESYGLQWIIQYV